MVKLFFFFFFFFSPFFVFFFFFFFFFHLLLTHMYVLYTYPNSFFIFFFFFFSRNQNRFFLVESHMPAQHTHNRDFVKTEEKKKEQGNKTDLVQARERGRISIIIRAPSQKRPIQNP